MTIAKAAKFSLNLLISIYALATLIFSWLFYLVLPNNAVFAFARTGFLLALIPALLFLLITLFITKHRTNIFLLLPATVIVLTYLTPYLLPSFASASSIEDSITVMTYNIQHQQDDESLETFANLIIDANPDIVALQELSHVASIGLSDLLREEYPYAAFGLPERLEHSWQGIYSRYPIIEEEFWDYQSELGVSHLHQRVTLNVEGEMVAFYNIHPNPPISWEGNFTFVANEADYIAHSVAMQRIINRVELEDYPVILVGDMNMSDQFAEYARLSTLLTDSFKQGGFGLGFSYPANSYLPPLIRIDHIFHSDEFTTHHAYVLPDSQTSDHLPVVAEIALLN